MKKLYFFLLFICSMPVLAQEVGIGQWYNHLPYHNAIQVALGNNKVYCANGYGLFSYDKSDNSIERLSKITGLSAVEVSTIRFNDITQTLVVGYADGNIDLIQDNVITNMADITRANIIGSKTINSIYFKDDWAYLACGFGIVVLDLSKKEIKDTYLIGSNNTYVNVNAITSDGERLYAATKHGIYDASLSNPNLSHFAAWTRHTTIAFPDSNYTAITYFNDKIYANFRGKNYNTDVIYIYDGNSWAKYDKIIGYGNHSLEVFNKQLIIAHNGSVGIYDGNGKQLSNIYTYNYASSIPPDPRHALLDENNYLWIADYEQGLVKNWKTWSNELIAIEGPESAYVTEIAASGGEIWIAPGRKTRSVSNLWEKAALYSFIDKKWGVINEKNTPQLDSIRDVIAVTIDPNDKNRIFAGSLGGGLFEFYNKKLVTRYTDKNSSLQSSIGFLSIGITGMAFDNDNNLWVVNSKTKKALSVQMTDSSWQWFDFSNTFNDNVITRGMLIDQYNQKWVIIAQVGTDKTGGILVFDDKSTLSDTKDDEAKFLTSSKGVGNLPSSDVYCMVEDFGGEIWVGTEKGIAVFYSPENVFTKYDFDAQQVYVQQDGYTQLLLETEVVTAIAIDGANRKWIGTANSGVFLMSEDGTEQIHHFSEDNSPLLSNNIMNIAIDHTTGEVYIGTDKGLISYRGTATGTNIEYQDVYVFPNPVREDYDGIIGIKGLVTNTHVKITDVNGNLVFETYANGGQATWNGRNLSGEKIHTGVYLVFCANEDGSKTYTTKMLVIGNK